MLSDVIGNLGYVLRIAGEYEVKRKVGNRGERRSEFMKSRLNRNDQKLSFRATCPSHHQSLYSYSQSSIDFIQDKEWSWLIRMDSK